jgi:hypothetical protein
LPHADVEFEFDGLAVRIMKAGKTRNGGRGERIVARPRGRGDVAMTTDAIMAPTRQAGGAAGGAAGDAD